MNEHLAELGRRLNVIDMAIAHAHAETDLERREHILQVVDRAYLAAHHEYDEAVEEDHCRPALRLLKGGPVATATGGMEWLHNRMKTRPQVGTAAALAAVTLTAAIVYAGMDHDGGHQTPAMPAPTSGVTLPPPGSAPSPTAPSSTQPAAPLVVPDAPSQRSLTPPTPSSSGPRQASGPITVSNTPPGPSATAGPPTTTLVATPTGSLSPTGNSATPIASSLPGGHCRGTHVPPIVRVSTCLVFTDR